MRKLYYLAAGLLAGFASLQPVLAQGPFTGKPRYLIQTKRAGVPLGDIKVELFPAIAPRHAANFDSLVNHQFYDSTAFHRVVPGFVIQGGDPNSRHGPRSTWGYGQPGQPTVKAEFSAVSHQRGILSAARSSNINSATSQFFICVAPATTLDGQYSVYGKVVEGMNWVDNIVGAPRDANDNPLQKVEMFVTYIGSNDSVPVAPVLVSPANNGYGQQDQLLDWNPVSDAMLYTVEVADNPAFSSPLHSVDIKQTLSSFTATNLQPSTQYYWRVRANNGGHVSAWSSYQFTTGMQAPTLVSPATGFNSAITTQTVEWTPLPGVSTYRLQVATTPQFTTASTVFDQGNLSGPTYQLSGLQLNTRYYWRVQGEQAGVPGFYSATWNFRVTSVSAVPGPAQAAAFSLGAAVPNPTSSLTQISFLLPAAGLADLRLYNAQGQQVAVLLSQQKAAGVHQVTFDAGTLPAGVYIYRLQAAGKHLTRKLIRL